MYDFKMKKLLIIAHNWPAPNFSAAGVRLMQLVDFFREEGYQITIASTADKSLLIPSGFKGIDLVSIQLNHSSFDGFVKELSPNIVLFDRFMTEEQFGWRVSENVPDALRILDTEDLHSLRKTRELALKNNTQFSRELWLQNELTKREIASIYRSDLSLIISSYEMELLESVITGHKALLLHLPFMLDALDESAIEKWKPFEERKGFAFIGFGGHAPNIDAISYLKKDIWPLIRQKLPGVNMNIYGGNLPEKVHQMNSPKEGFLIKGWVEDAKEVIESSKVMLAPLRFGAGLKGKLIDAMQTGTPSITTSIGAEGMQKTLDWNGEICDDPKSFATAAVTLYQDEIEWKQAQRNAIEVVNTIYDKSVLSKTLSLKIASINENLEAHRTNNFIGSMLQHQTLASTKYMAKWIAEKKRG